MAEQEQAPEERRTGDAARAAELFDNMRVKSASYAKGVQTDTTYRVKKEGDVYVIFNERTGNKTPHSDVSHRNVIKAFRQDSDYGEALALLTDHEGDE